MSKGVNEKDRPKMHHAHVIIPEDVWQALKKIGEKARPKKSVTALLIDGARNLIDRE